MITKGGLIGKKQEMTKVWHDGKQVPVTLVKLCDQEIIRHKTVEKDGYNAVVIGVGKCKKKSSRGNEKTVYSRVVEMRVAPDFFETYTVGTSLGADILEGIDSLRVFGRSKGKGFAGVMKRHNFAGGPATHGSKFHRAGGSAGNRKPRRTIRGWKMAGHMGDENITLRAVPVINTWSHDGDTYVVMKGSLPGGFDSYIDLLLV